MKNPENYPLSQDDNDPQLTIIMGDGSPIWRRTPEDFGVTKPINPDLFAGSNLMRRLQPHARIVRTGVHGRLTETHIERTSLALIVGEVYRKCLPRDSRELAQALEQQAFEEEIAYEAEGIDSDPGYQAYLGTVAQAHTDSLVMRGFEAFLEAAWDFAGNTYQDLLKDARRFAAYMIDIDSA